jgi:hypothetical protein
MSASIVFASNFDATKLSVSAPRPVGTSGAKQAYVNYEGNKLIVQTPTHMSLPYGLGVLDKAKMGGVGVDYSLDMSLKGYNQDGSPVKAYYDAIKAFDEVIITEAHKNRMSWFKADHPKEVIRAFYTSSLKFSKDEHGNVKDYPPTQKVKLRQYEGKFETEFYNTKRQQYKDEPLNEIIVKGSQITALIECGGVWFAGGKFGCTWRAKQVMIQKSPEALKGFSFVGVAAEEADEEEAEQDNTISDSAIAAVMPAAPKPVAAAPAPSPAATANAFADVEVPADDEEHEAEDAPPEPVPKKITTVKKVIKTVKKAGVA